MSSDPDYDALVKDIKRVEFWLHNGIRINLRQGY